MSSRTLLEHRLEDEDGHQRSMIDSSGGPTCSFATKPLNNAFSGMINVLLLCVATTIAIGLLDNRNHFFVVCVSNVHFFLPIVCGKPTSKIKVNFLFSRNERWARASTPTLVNRKCAKTWSNIRSYFTSALSLSLARSLVCILAYDQPRNYGYRDTANGSTQVAVRLSARIGSEQSVWKWRRSGR